MYYQQPVYQPYPMYYVPPIPQNMGMGIGMQNQMQQQAQPIQPVQSNQPIQQAEQNKQIIQSSSDFIKVKNIEEAKNYPVAPGHCVSFQDENAPYIYTKTMGFSQFDRPRFEKIRLVKETEDEELNTEETVVEKETKEGSSESFTPVVDIESNIVGSPTIQNINNTLLSFTDEVELIHKDIKSLKEKVDDISKRRKVSPKKVGDSDDE